MNPPRRTFNFGELAEDNHPLSGHRSPREIAEDEAGPIGFVDLDTTSREASDENGRLFPASRLPPSNSSKRTKRRN